MLLPRITSSNCMYKLFVKSHSLTKFVDFS